MRPYQPEGLWTELGTGASYVQDHGDSLYRRSMYIFSKRTVPPPSLANFDASSREAHVVKPVVTNTPLQALNLMNDVAYVEAARRLAERLMVEGGATPEARVAFAYRTATAQRPGPRAQMVLVNSFRQQLNRYKADRKAALALVSAGDSKRDESLDVTELAAYTMVANLILNLDQTMTKE